VNAIASKPELHRCAPSGNLRRESGTAWSYGLAAGMAVALHAAVLFAWEAKKVFVEPVEFGVEVGDSSVEVELVAALPAEVPEEAPEADIVPEAPTEPEPVAEPPQDPEAIDTPPEQVVEEVVPEPQPPPPAEKEPEAVPEPPKPVKPAPRPKAPAARRPAGDGSSAVPGRDATTSASRAGAQSAKPGYLRNPHPSYPEAARTARQQGLVMVAVDVDAAGRPARVTVSRSSGYPLLDERARSTVANQWRFKPARVNGAAVASRVIIPIRFTLGR